METTALRLPDLTPEEAAAAARRALQSLARAELWRRREVWPLLECYLDRDQLDDARRIFEGVDIQRGELPRDDYVLDISRQRGKSWLCCVLWVVLCHCIPKFVVKYCAQQQKSVRAIVQPTVDAIVEDCPEELRPRFVSDDSKWLFSNGSNCTAAGADNGHYTALRGQRAHLVIKDEAGFYPDYDAVDRVLSPQLSTTKGITIDASTPPETPGHPYTTTAMAAKQRGRYSHRTIYNHPRMTPEEIEAFLTKEAAKKGLTLEQFKDTTYYKREFLCQHVMEEGRAVVPEWAMLAVKPCEEHPEGVTIGQLATREWVRPERYTAYTVVDPGSTDLFAGLFAYYDFVAAKLIVEDEAIERDPDTDTAGEALKAGEARTWGEDLGAGKVDAVLRFCDVDRRLVKDLAQAPHNLPFVFTEKADVDAARNNCRAMLARGEIIINPRCKTLLLTLETAIWNERRTDIVRTRQTGHADAFMALVYLVRNLQKERNPFPPAPDTTVLQRPTPKGSPMARRVGKALGPGLKPLT